MKGTAYPAASLATALLALGTARCLIPISNADTGGDGGPDGAVVEGGNDAGNDADTSVASDANDGASDDAAIVGTPPTGSWSNVTANLANIPSGCSSLALLAAKPNEDMLIASVFGVGLFATKNGDGTWQALGAPDAATPITHALTSIAYDPSNASRFWECGLHGSSPSMTSDDGQTFVPLGQVSNNELISVDFADNAQTILLGSHEAAQTLYRSTNGGSTWTNIGGTLPAQTFCTLPVLLDAQTYLIGCNGTSGGPSGIYRTTDGAATWQQVSASGGGLPPLLAADGSIYWVSPNGAGMTRSTDKGATWTDVLGGGVIFPSAQAPLPIELPDGRLAVMGQQYVLVSADHGAHWSPKTAAFPPGASNDAAAPEDLHGVVYSPQRKAFYVWHNQCPGGGAPVPVASDAVLRFDFDYTTN